mmetsp:Transcript_60428/g.156944  ORF Transcript_60428/g.156944 Transcript_60428/m.156944 type:complete len:219 (-) Transcript_60428:535-1191(-)
MPPRHCRVFSATSPLACILRARFSSSCAACGNCCCKLSSSGIHASFAMAARPLRTASDSAGAWDITCKTAMMPPTCPRVHMVSSVTFPGNRKPHVTRTSSAPRARNLCATAALPSTSVVMSCTPATKRDEASEPAAWPARSASRVASAPPFSTKSVPRQGCASMRSRKAEQHAHSKSTLVGWPGCPLIASSKRTITVSAWGHSVTPAWPRSRCFRASS